MPWVIHNNIISSDFATYSDVRHGAQVIDLVGSNLGYDMEKIRGITQISVVQKEANTSLVKS
jgi:hypothetical protein